MGRRGIPWEVSINTTNIFVKVHLYTSSYSMPGIFGHPIFTDLTVCSAIGVQDPRRNRICELSPAMPSLREGDMVLLDNYLVMHGRCPFEGTRLHAVSWFKSQMLSPCSIHAQSIWLAVGMSHVGRRRSDMKTDWYRILMDFVHCVGISQSFCDFEKKPV